MKHIVKLSVICLPLGSCNSFVNDISGGVNMIGSFLLLFLITLLSLFTIFNFISPDLERYKKKALSEFEINTLKKKIISSAIINILVTLFIVKVSLEIFWNDKQNSYDEQTFYKVLFITLILILYFTGLITRILKMSKLSKKINH